MQKQHVEAEDNNGNQDSMIEYRQEKMLLPCVLTDRERLEYGENIARTIQAIGETKEAAKAAADDFKAKTSELEKGLALDARVLRLGKVERQVDVVVVLNYRVGYVRTSRMDTAEEIEQRPMTSIERQQGMKF